MNLPHHRHAWELNPRSDGLMVGSGFSEILGTNDGDRVTITLALYSRQQHR